MQKKNSIVYTVFSAMLKVEMRKGKIFGVYNREIVDAYSLYTNNFTPKIFKSADFSAIIMYIYTQYTEKKRVEIALYS